VLQEELAQALADALLEGVEAKAAVAVIEARHLCVAITDLARANTTFRSTAVAGDRERAAGLMAEIDAALRPPAAEPPR
jgi:GTP cyclohydrolase I